MKKSVIIVYSCLSLFVGNTQAQDYQVTDLGNGAAYGINNSGQVVGYIQPGDSPSIIYAFLYSGGQVQNLGTLGGLNSIAYGINNNGQVVGTSGIYNSTGLGASVNPFLYSDGVMQSLGEINYGNGAAFGINDNGQVVGWSGNQPFIYSNGSMMDLGILPGVFWGSYALGINSQGQIVGTCNTPSGNDSDDHAFLYSNGSMLDLNNLINPSSDWVLNQATGINDSGEIVGWGIGPDGKQDAFLLETPEPTVLLPVGLAVLALWRRR
jgi:probable HAF family extracellular repeat protein